MILDINCTLNTANNVPTTNNNYNYNTVMMLKLLML